MVVLYVWCQLLYLLCLWFVAHVCVVLCTCVCWFLYFSEKYVVALQQMGLPKENEKINQTFVTFTVWVCVCVCMRVCVCACAFVHVYVCTCGICVCACMYGWVCSCVTCFMSLCLLCAHIHSTVRILTIKICSTRSYIFSVKWSEYVSLHYSKCERNFIQASLCSIIFWRQEGCHSCQNPSWNSRWARQLCEGWWHSNI